MHRRPPLSHQRGHSPLAPGHFLNGGRDFNAARQPGVQEPYRCTVQLTFLHMQGMLGLHQHSGPHRLVPETEHSRVRSRSLSPSRQRDSFMFPYSNSEHLYRHQDQEASRTQRRVQSRRSPLQRGRAAVIGEQLPPPYAPSRPRGYAVPHVSGLVLGSRPQFLPRLTEALKSWRKP